MQPDENHHLLSSNLDSFVAKESQLLLKTGSAALGEWLTQSPVYEGEKYMDWLTSLTPYAVAGYVSAAGGLVRKMLIDSSARGGSTTGVLRIRAGHPEFEFKVQAGSLFAKDHPRAKEFTFYEATLAQHVSMMCRIPWDCALLSWLNIIRSLAALPNTLRFLVATKVGEDEFEISLAPQDLSA